MRMSLVLSLLLAAFATPAIATDANLERDVKKAGSAYVDANKQDGAGIAALFASGDTLVREGNEQILPFDGQEPERTYGECRPLDRS